MLRLAHLISIYYYIKIIPALGIIKKFKLSNTSLDYWSKIMLPVIRLIYNNKKEPSKLWNIDKFYKPESENNIQYRKIICLF